MYVPPFTVTSEILHLVSEISERVGAINVTLGDNAPSPMLRKDNRIKTIHSSLAIEHNSLSLQQVTDIIDGKHVLGAPNEIQEVKNAVQAYQLMQHLDAFKEIYPKLIAGRYQGKDIQFIVEHNSPISTSVLEQLASAIEINREQFFNHQRLLVARHNEHKTFIESFPACILLPSAQEIKITVIKSDHTAEVYATGKENI